MTRIIIFLLVSLLILISCAGYKQNASQGVQLTVTTPHITQNGGTMYYSLYRSEEDFNNKKSLQSKHMKVNQNRAQVTFTNLPQGTYAVLCFYDTNNNQKLDFDGFIPSEDFGCSNNPQLMGPPNFKQLQFEVKDRDLVKSIRIQ